MNQISKDELKDRRQYITSAVEAAIEKNNYTKLAALVEFADEYGVKKSLRYKAWLILGMQWKNERQFVDAAIALNAARRTEPLKTSTVRLLFECIMHFVEEYRTIFSLSDLTKIEIELERILEFYKVKKLWTHPVIKDGRNLYEQVKLIKQTAKEVVETPATHKTDRITNALHTNVSIDEVRADFARIVTPYLLEMIAEEKKKEAKKKRRTKKD